MSGALAFAAGTHSDRHFASVFVTAPDGLRLHIRSYGSRVASALPVVCLAALARSALVRILREKQRKSAQSSASWPLQSSFRSRCTDGRPPSPECETVPLSFEC